MSRWDRDSVALLTIAFVVQLVLITEIVYCGYSGLATPNDRFWGALTMGFTALFALGFTIGGLIKYSDEYRSEKIKCQIEKARIRKELSIAANQGGGM